MYVDIMIIISEITENEYRLIKTEEKTNGRRNNTKHWAEIFEKQNLKHISNRCSYPTAQSDGHQHSGSRQINNFNFCATTYADFLKNVNKFEK